MIGRPLRRLEDPRLIRGEGRYVDDLSRRGTLHCVFVRSVEAHALIRSVEFDPPPDSAAILIRADDIGLDEPMPMQNPSGLISQPVTPPVLAGHEVCYVGQAIAMVIAPTVAEAIDAADAVHIDYDTLPASIDHTTTLDPTSAPVHIGAESNRAATIRAGFGDPEAAMSGRVARLEFDQDRGALASLEGRAVLADWDETDQRLLVWTSSQSPHAVKKSIAGYLGLSPDSVRVSTPDVGGGFGPKAVVHPEEIAIAAASRQLRAPVKWTERRREHFTATIQQRSQSGTVEFAYDDQGRLRAVRARLIHDMGAYVPYGVVVPSTTMRLMSGPYRISDLEVQIECVLTNKTPTGAIRGAGRPNAVFILERIMDYIASDLSLGRAEVRKRNFIAPDEMPYRVDIPSSNGSPITYDGGDYPAGLEAALAAAGIGGFESRRSDSARRNRLRGYGVASYVEDTGIGPYDGARVEIVSNGEIVVHTGSSSQGQGHHTVFAQVCAASLGVDPGLVRVESGDTDRYPHGVPTVASRTGQTVASAVHVASEALATEVKKMAASELEASPEDIVLLDGVAMVVGQPGSEIPLGELARLAESKPPQTTDRPHGAGLAVEMVQPFEGSAFTFGTHVAEVEIDPDTGHVDVERYTVVHDCGTVLNPMIVDGQIDGGVAHGLGNATSERIVHDSSGQPLTTSFMDYALMTAMDMPVLTKVHLETPSPSNPLGAKGAGEGGTIPVAAAVVSAIEHALGGIDPPITHYPVTPEYVMDAVGRTTSVP